MFTSYYVKFYVTSYSFFVDVRVIRKKLTKAEFELLSRKFVYDSTGLFFKEHTINSIFLSEEDLNMYLKAFGEGLYYNVTVVHPNGAYVVFLDEKAYEWMYKVGKREYPKHLMNNAYFFEEEFQHFMSMYKVIRSIDEQLEEE